MTPRGRALVGVLTTAVFFGLAVMLTLEQRYSVAGLLYVLGALRAFVAVRQLRDAFGADDEGPE
jgi:hypothetical protein